jgi:flagellar capping protein FliD
MFEKLKDGLQNSIYTLKTQINSTCTSYNSKEKKYKKHEGFFIQK